MVNIHHEENRSRAFEWKVFFRDISLVLELIFGDGLKSGEMVIGRRDFSAPTFVPDLNSRIPLEKRIHPHQSIALASFLAKENFIAEITIEALTDQHRRLGDWIFDIGLELTGGWNYFGCFPYYKDCIEFLRNLRSATSDETAGVEELVLTLETMALLRD
ncbi:hypothetical protein Tco_1122183 [Tanacetum coccineum]|uniref:Uncharacterized protein n=1 Tax=Tanacetum coccineum TaxID=301880 RepID=A0ABQ5IZT9_9ASTR